MAKLVRVRRGRWLSSSEGLIYPGTILPADHPAAKANPQHVTAVPDRDGPSTERLAKAVEEASEEVSEEPVEEMLGDVEESAADLEKLTGNYSTPSDLGWDDPDESTASEV